MCLDQLNVDGYQPLMKSGEHQWQESSRQYRTNQETAAVDSPGCAVSDRFRNPASKRLQRHNRDGPGNDGGQQRVKNKLQRFRQQLAEFALDPTHQRNHQQHCDHPAAPRLQRFAKQGNLRQLRAGEDPRHHPAHRQRAAEDFGGIHPNQNIHDGKHGATKYAHQPQHIRIMGRKIPHDVRALKDVNNAGNQTRGDKRRNKRDKDVRQLAQRIAHWRFVLRFGL